MRDFELLVALAKEVMSFVIGEDHLEAWKTNKGDFSINLYEYKEIFDKNHLSNLFSALKTFLRGTLFEDLNKPEYKYEISILYAVFNLFPIWLAIETQQNKGKQHTYPEFLAKPYMDKGWLDVLDLDNKIKYRAHQNYILCYEDKIYSDSLEQYFSLIEREYAAIAPKLVPAKPLTAYERFVISLFLGTLSERCPESAIVYNRGKNPLNPNRDKDDDLNIAFNIVTQTMHKILLNRWLFVEAVDDRFPFFLGSPAIYNKEDAKAISYDKLAMSFSLKPNLKLILPQTERELMDTRLSKLVGDRLYKNKLGHVAYIRPTDSQAKRVTDILVEYDIISAFRSVHKLLVFKSPTDVDSIINPYLNFAKFSKELKLRRVEKDKLGGIKSPNLTDTGVVKLLIL